MGPKIALVLCLALAGCVTAPSEDGNPRKTWCDHNKPMRPSAAVFAVMTRPEIDDMNSHNAQGVKWCAWQP